MHRLALEERVASDLEHAARRLDKLRHRQEARRRAREAWDAEDGRAVAVASTPAAARRGERERKQGVGEEEGGGGAAASEQAERQPKRKEEAAEVGAAAAVGERQQMDVDAT